ncbi:MAG: alpha-isopropylmalate synthase regulatory domain-containing protein [Acutalibacteraceae bacterium]|nr:alpha-isopropylmalate synthase regulatory domain-containing protein [Acutalibacteraceae bacterium]
MKNIKITDITLCRNKALSFKERIEIARLLDRLNVDTIELPQIDNIKSDTLLIRTISSFVKESKLSVCCGYNVEGVELAAAALNNTKNPEIRVELPMSPVGMEYTCHKKAPAMIELIKALVTSAKEKCENVQFCAVDATRAEEQFLTEAINTAIEAGANSVTVCDTTGEMLPDEFAKFVENIKTSVKETEFAVSIEDKNGMATAASILAVKSGADGVKTAVSGGVASLETFAGLIKNCGNTCGFSCNIKHTETGRIVKQIARITDSNTETAAPAVRSEAENAIHLDGNDSIEAVAVAVQSLGYDLSEEDIAKVYEEFGRIASKKRVGAKELDAIVASTALQVPPTYKLISYVINNGNIISSSAQLRLSKGDEELEGICIGDGPVDAAFRAIEQIIGRHYELDDFQIQTVTEGRDSMGSALVRLREGGKLYSGTGISTDILGASIRAYINALNKIVYEEAN